MSITVSGNVYKEGNKDNITEAVRGLDVFTKNWCMNCEETDKESEPIFRCSECEFLKEGKICMIKSFANNHNHNYPMNDFGSMGSH